MLSNSSTMIFADAKTGRFHARFDDGTHRTFDTIKGKIAGMRTWDREYEGERRREIQLLITSDDQAIMLSGTLCRNIPPDEPHVSTYGWMLVNRLYRLYKETPQAFDFPMQLRTWPIDTERGSEATALQISIPGSKQYSDKVEPYYPSDVQTGNRFPIVNAAIKELATILKPFGSKQTEVSSYSKQESVPTDPTASSDDELPF